MQKLVNVTDIKIGNVVVLDDMPCTIKSIDISKTGKHGASKVRIEAIGIFDEKKRVIVKPGHERLVVPLVEKKRAQILSIGEKATIMDIESFETFDVNIASEIKEQIKEGMQVEYWKINNKAIAKRII